ncbi:hypothetical protein FACS189465_1090 [Clostridia bacterium]|nr:hypothetical protein FACS189465_1090 [Clostridia bacterium]
MEGKSQSAIAKILTNRKIPTPSGKEKWSKSTVRSILTNEKYKGDALLQKGYTVDFLTKKRKKNEGEIPQYYVENSHEAIIDPEIFETVQNEIKARQIEISGHSSIHTFASKLVCGDCSGYFGSKLWHSTDKYRCRIWQCNQKFKNKQKCGTPHLKEKQIKQIFVDAFNKLMADKSAVIADCNAVLNEICDTSKFDDKIQKLTAEKNKIENEVQLLVAENASTAQKQEIYNEKRNIKVAEFQKLEQKILDLECQKAKQTTKQCQIEKFLKKVDECDNFLTEFDEELWFSLVKNITVKTDNTVIVAFKNDVEIISGMGSDQKRRI